MQEVTILHTQFKTHVVSFWLCYAAWWMFTNTLIYKSQRTNMADNKNDVIFFLAAGSLFNIDIRLTWYIDLFMLYILGIYRSSHQRCSRKKDVLTNLAKFTGKHLFQSLFFNKVTGQRPEVCNFFKKRDFSAVVFLPILEILYKQLFHATPLGDCFWIWNSNIRLVWIKNSFYSGQWQYKKLWTVFKISCRSILVIILTKFSIS